MNEDKNLEERSIFEKNQKILKVKKILEKIQKIDQENPKLGDYLDHHILRFAQSESLLNYALIKDKLSLFKDFKPIYSINNISNYSVNDFFVKWFCMSYIVRGVSKEYTLFRLLILLKMLKYKNSDKILPDLFMNFKELILDKDFPNLKNRGFDQKSLELFKELLGYYSFPYQNLLFSNDPKNNDIDPRIFNNPDEFKDPYFNPAQTMQEFEDGHSTQDLLIKWFAEAIIERGYPPEIALYELLKHLKDLGFSSRDEKLLDQAFSEFKSEILDVPKNYERVIIPDSEFEEFKQLLVEFSFPFTDQLNFANIHESETGSKTEKTTENIAPLSKSNSDVVNYALGFVGKGVAYSMGAKNPITEGGPCDCSGFTKQVFQAKGISISDGSQMQINQGVNVDKSDLRPGDLVFFQGTIKGRPEGQPSHVGIYSGNGNFVSLTGHGVKDQPLNSGFWADKYLSARRVTA